MTIEIDLPRGVLTRIEYLFPSGQFCLAKVAVFYGLERISPHRYGDWLCGNDEKVVDDLSFELPDEPTRLTVAGYNLDDVYDHTVYLRFQVQTPENITPRLLTRLLRALGLR